MNEEKLVQHIVEEVYRKLQLKETSKPKVLVIGHLIKEQQEQLEQTYESVSIETKPIDFDFVIISKLNLKLLTELALGLPHSMEATLVLDALLLGKNIYVLEQGITYRAFKETAHKNIYGLYSDYELRLRNFGIRFVKHLPTFSKESASKEAQKSKKKVITEAYLNKIYSHGMTEIKVDSEAIITPLAVDFIESHHITVQRYDGG